MPRPGGRGQEELPLREGPAHSKEPSPRPGPHGRSEHLLPPRVPPGGSIWGASGEGGSWLPRLPAMTPAPRKVPQVANYSPFGNQSSCFCDT